MFRDVDVTSSETFGAGIPGNPYSMLEENICRDDCSSELTSDSEDEAEFEARYARPHFYIYNYF